MFSLWCLHKFTCRSGGAALTMLPMSSHHPFFRVFLMLALLLNGLAVAHAAVGHALMQMPEPHEASALSMGMGMAMDEGDAMGEGDCHEMAEHTPALDASSESPPHKGMACCQGAVCNCACALQMPVSVSAIAVHVHGQSVQPGMATNSYRSIDLSLILRPPIA